MTTLIWSITDEVVDEACNPKTIAVTQYTSNVCIARRLRMRRSSLGISNREFCARLGIDRYDLEAYEKGAKRVNANLLLRIAKVLDVQPDYFFNGYTGQELSACLESVPLAELKRSVRSS
jgi:transcriptional regulator with XRE-family HTH domain